MQAGSAVVVSPKALPKLSRIKSIVQSKDLCPVFYAFDTGTLPHLVSNVREDYHRATKKAAEPSHSSIYRSYKIYQQIMW